MKATDQGMIDLNRVAAVAADGDERRAPEAQQRRLVEEDDRRNQKVDVEKVFARLGGGSKSALLSAC